MPKREFRSINTRRCQRRLASDAYKLDKPSRVEYRLGDRRQPVESRSLALNLPASLWVNLPSLGDLLDPLAPAVLVLDTAPIIVAFANGYILALSLRENKAGEGVDTF